MKELIDREEGKIPDATEFKGDIVVHVVDEETPVRNVSGGNGWLTDSDDN
jgi:hypothetical protein